MKHHPMGDVVPGVSIVDTAEDLCTLQNPDMAAVIWDRALPDGFQTWVDALPPEQLPGMRMIVEPRLVQDVLTAVCEETGTPACAHRDWLVADVASLAERFLAELPAHWLRVRMDVVDDNACRRFHIDAVKARLICTYRGQGTEYGTTEQGAEPAHIHQVPTGCPVILRGTQWPESPESGLRHRSPPIQGTGETRLLLVIDPIFDPVEEE